jgi:hypothetical protein
MDHSDPFICEQHPKSNRHATLEDDGRTGWFYLSAADSLRPVADAWVYNRNDPPEDVDDSDRERPPPLISRFASIGAVVSLPSKVKWTIRWSDDGHSVAIYSDGRAVALLTARQKHGYSLGLSSECPWGKPLTPEVLAAIRVG